MAHSCNTLFHQPLYIFPNRRFRHDVIYVAEGSGIRFAEDLRGGRIGITKLTQTAVITARGVLADQYGLEAHQVEWVVGPMNDPADGGINLPDTPSHIRISPLRGSRSLDRKSTRLNSSH